jgi:hypothetical protein
MTKRSSPSSGYGAAKHTAETPGMLPWMSAPFRPPGIANGPLTTALLGRGSAKRLRLPLDQGVDPRRTLTRPIYRRPPCFDTSQRSVAGPAQPYGKALRLDGRLPSPLITYGLSERVETTLETPTAPMSAWYFTAGRETNEVPTFASIAPKHATSPPPRKRLG